MRRRRSLGDGVPGHAAFIISRQDAKTQRTQWVGRRIAGKANITAADSDLAQEKSQTWNGRKVNGQFAFTRDKTVYVNHYYFYIDDADCGPVFIKVCSYAPWGIKFCLNGHEWAKRQMERRKIPYEVLDNGFLSCADAEQLQQICDALVLEGLPPHAYESASMRRSSCTLKAKPSSEG